MADYRRSLMHGASNVSNSIAHDLRTPLAELRARLEEIALTRPAAAETFAEIEAAVADVDRVMRMFNALLRLAEIDSGARRSGFVRVDAAAVAAEVAAHRPDIVFVAMPSPRKEYWLGTYGRRLGAPFIMGVGGSIDVLAGHVRRAPVLLQRLGLEWLFRLAQEPRRMFRRYLWGNTRFIAYVAGDFARRHLR